MPHVPAAVSGRKGAYVARNRVALVAATQRVLADLGSQATAEQVAERAGVAVSTLYKHFESKGDLFAAAFAAALNEWEGSVDLALANVSNPAERLVFPMRYMVEVPATHELFARMVARNPDLYRHATTTAELGMLDALDKWIASSAQPVEGMRARARNMQVLLFAIMLDRCLGTVTPAEGLESISVGLEMLALDTDLIQRLMAAPMPAPLVVT